MALDILWMRLHADRDSKREHDLNTLEACRELLRRVTFSRGKQNEYYHLAEIAKASLIPKESAQIVAELAIKMREAIASYKISASDCQLVLAELISLHPTVVLDALFEGDDEAQQDGVHLFEYSWASSAKALDGMPCETLISWCENDPERRYGLAASIIHYVRKDGNDDPLEWSEQALALLTKAPDTQKVLAIFVQRFTPMSWSGSRAAIMEANSSLLDNMDSIVPANAMPFVAEVKAQIREAIAYERKEETERDRKRDERFE